MADVFISYSKRDRDLARVMSNALEQNGRTVWWDHRITPVENWDKTIEREISEAKSVVVLWTHSSIESDWVRTEADFAKTRGKLVQCVFDDVDPPLAFRMVQFVSFADMENLQNNPDWDRFLAWTLAPGSTASTKPAAQKPPELVIDCDGNISVSFDVVVQVDNKGMEAISPTDAHSDPLLRLPEEGRGDFFNKRLNVSLPRTGVCRVELLLRGKETGELLFVSEPLVLDVRLGHRYVVSAALQKKLFSHKYVLSLLSSTRY